MIVIAGIAQGAQVPTQFGPQIAPQNVYNVCWFDKNDVLQERNGMLEMWLEKVEDEEKPSVITFPNRIPMELGSDPNDPTKTS